MTIELPPYKSSGPGHARVLREKARDLRKLAAGLAAEIEQTELAFAQGFEKVDAATTARDRIAALAKDARRSNR